MGRRCWGDVGSVGSAALNPGDSSRNTVYRKRAGLRDATGVLSGWQPLPDHGSLSAMAYAPNPYRGFRYPTEVIQHAVWLYHCFSLSLRDVETILAARGIVVSYESIRECGLRFGRQFVNELKRRRPRPGDKWHLDE